MKATRKIRPDHGLKKFFILFLAFVLLCLGASCSKESIPRTDVDFSFVFVADRSAPTKEIWSKYLQLQPVYAIVKTDRGTFRFGVSRVDDQSFQGETMTWKKGRVKILDLRLYDIDGNETHYVKERQPDGSGGNGVVSWVGETHTFDDRMQNFNYPFHIFYTDI